ncbi:MAG: hypothetical protein LUD54_03770, partial [Oscillospiraceae bacterium]|nr:hypothetical protein [Oscillospiraceae bacterium]
TIFKNPFVGKVVITGEFLPVPADRNVQEWTGFCRGAEFRHSCRFMQRCLQNTMLPPCAGEQSFRATGGN